MTKGPAAAFLLLTCLTACDDEDHDPAADAQVSTDGGATTDMAPSVGMCSPTVEDVYPSPACSGPVPELLIQDDDLPLARELLVGRWYRCSPGEIFIEDEDTDGIEFTADGQWYSLKSPTPGERPERLMDPRLHGTWALDLREDRDPPTFCMSSSDGVIGTVGTPRSIGCDPHQLALGEAFLARGPGAGPAPAVAAVADFPDEDCAPGDLQTPMDTDEGAVLAGLAGLWRLCSGNREHDWLRGPGEVFGVGLTVEGVWTRLLRVGDQVVLGQHVGDVGGFFVFEDEDQTWRIDFGPPIESGFPYANGELRVSEQTGQWQLETFDGEVFLFSGPRGEQR